MPSRDKHLQLAVGARIVLIDPMPDLAEPQPNIFRRCWQFLASLVRRLLDLKDKPHAIAGGVAIGMFIGFTPLFGIKTLLCLGLALALRCNPIAAVVAVSLHDVVTPIWPVLLLLEYQIGFWVLSSPHHLPPSLEHHHFHIAEMMTWKTFSTVGLPILVGSLFLAVPAAALSYVGMLAFLKRREAKRAAAQGD